MTPRLRRLQADFQNVTAIFANHPHIRVVEMEGSPPEKYLCEFTVEGLVPQAEESFVPGSVRNTITSPSRT